MNSIEWLIEQLEERGHIIPDHLEETAIKMHKQEIIDAWEDGYGGDEHNSDEYYNEIFGSKGSGERIVDTNKTIKLDCPYDFTSRCTMGSCDCKPKQETTSSQPEISDEEIEEASLYIKTSDYKVNTNTPFYHVEKAMWRMGAKWYREKLKQKQ
jgi:hypothetical protein